MTAPPGRVAHVILDSPLPQLDHPFDYAIPEHLRGTIEFGMKVNVPLRTGNRRSEAWVIGISDTTAFTGNLASLDSVVSPVPTLTPELYELARTVADRQAGSAVDILRLAIPPRYVRAERAYVEAAGGNETHEPPPALAHAIADEMISLAQGTRVALEIRGGVQRLTDELTVPQWVRAFVRVAHEHLVNDNSSILCVPDFRDVDVVEAALQAAGLGRFVVRTDTHLAGAQRWHNYLRLLHEQPVVVLGNRSSVYAPAKNLGVIAIWDGADDAFTEPLAPYAHPRDVALIRQAETGCSLIFASHVQSVDTTRLIGLGYLTPSVWGERDVDIVAWDLHSQSDDEGPTSRIPPAALVAARAAIANGPVLVQVARPGYAASLVCASCRERAVCSTCSGPLALKSKNALPSCRWCAKLEPSWSCSSCHSTGLLPRQAGTEKTADDLARAFPGVLVHFFDASKEVQTIAFTPSLVIATAGTEPIAASGYAAVLILDGEAARSREDLDTDSTALRTWMNAAALAVPGASVFIAGSGRTLGDVLERGTFAEFSQHTLREREALGLPPTTRVAVLTGSRAAISDVEAALTNIPHRSVLGPVPHIDGSYRLIVTFDYKDGVVVAKALRALMLKTAVTTRKPAGATKSTARILRLNVRIDDFALRGIG
jgi:primosomal protein N' (replication factor Y)